ncbi:hypothetical protein Tco_0264636 [Tanacetum coccineum]
MRLSIRSWVTEWKGLPLLLLAKKQSRDSVVPRCPRYHIGDVDAQTRLRIYILSVKITPLRVNGVRQLQALVDKKRVIVTESSIRRDLHLDDAEGTDCLPTATIFEELARKSKRIASSKKEIDALKKRIQRLERRKMSMTKGRSITDIDVDVESTKPDGSTAGKAVTTASVEDSVVPTTIKEIILAQTLIQIKAAKPKVVTTATTTTTTTTRPKERGVVVQEPKIFKAKFLGFERDSHFKGKERGMLTDEEKGKLFMELMEKRRKHFVALRAQEKRNRPPTKAQKRTQMSIILSTMGGTTTIAKGKGFHEFKSCLIRK